MSTKRADKDGRRHKAKTPKQVEVRKTVETLRREGKPINRKELGAQLGVGEHAVQLALAEVQGKLDAEADPIITSEMLSKSAQEKLASAMRQYQKKLDADYERRVQEGIKQRVDAMVLPAFKEEREDHALMVKCRKGAFTRDEYNAILRCVHPDRSPTIEEKNEAFRLMHERRLVLLSDKDDPRVYPKIPTANEIMRGTEPKKN